MYVIRYCGYMYSEKLGIAETIARAMVINCNVCGCKHMLSVLGNYFAVREHTSVHTQSCHASLRCKQCAMV